MSETLQAPPEQIVQDRNLALDMAHAERPFLELEQQARELKLDHAAGYLALQGEIASDEVPFASMTLKEAEIDDKEAPETPIDLTVEDNPNEPEDTSGRPEGAIIEEDTSGEVMNAEKQKYMDKALANLKATSRTASGKIDTSASSTKGDSMVQGLSEEQIADTATRNFTETIGELYELRSTEFQSPAELREFVETVAKQINGGIVKDGELLRSGEDSAKYPYTKISELEGAMDDFYTTLLEKIQDPNTDPTELAAWTEYRIDLTDHFFADGCGKTAKAISAWTLMRSGQDLPTYRGREELYQHAPKTIRTQDPAQARVEEKAWLDYYKTLL